MLKHQFVVRRWFPATGSLQIPQANGRDVARQRIKKLTEFLRSAWDRIPSTGRRPIVTKTAAEPNGVEALEENSRRGALVWIMPRLA